MATVTYNRGKYRVARDGGNNLTFQALLLTVAPAGCLSPDLNTVADVLAVATAAEANHASYARQTLGTVTITQDNTNDRVNFDALDIDFGALDQTTVAAVVIFVQGASDAARDVVSISTDNLPKVANGAGFKFTVNDFLRAN